MCDFLIRNPGQVERVGVVSCCPLLVRNYRNAQDEVRQTLKNSCRKTKLEQMLPNSAFVTVKDVSSTPTLDPKSSFSS